MRKVPFVNDSSVCSESGREQESNLGFTTFAPEAVPDATLNLQGVLAQEEVEPASDAPSRATPVRTTVLDPEERRKQAMVH